MTVYILVRYLSETVTNYSFEIDDFQPTNFKVLLDYLFHHMKSELWFSVLCCRFPQFYMGKVSNAEGNYSQR